EIPARRTAGCSRSPMRSRGTSLPSVTAPWAICSARFRWRRGLPRRPIQIGNTGTTNSGVFAIAYEIAGDITAKRYSAVGNLLGTFQVATGTAAQTDPDRKYRHDEQRGVRDRL